MWDLSFPRDGTAAVALEGSSLTHWTTGEVPVQFFFFFFLRFFDMDHLLNSLLNLLQYCFIFMFWFLAARHVGS